MCVCVLDTYIYINITKVLKDFQIQVDHLNSARRPDQVIVNRHPSKNRSSRLVDFAVSADHRAKLKVGEKRVRYEGFVRELKKP